MLPSILIVKNRKLQACHIIYPRILHCHILSFKTETPSQSPKSHFSHQSAGKNKGNSTYLTDCYKKGWIDMTLIKNRPQSFICTDILQTQYQIFYL